MVSIQGSFLPLRSCSADSSRPIRYFPPNFSRKSIHVVIVTSLLCNSARQLLVQIVHELLKRNNAIANQSRVVQPSAAVHIPSNHLAILYVTYPGLQGGDALE